MSPPRVRIVPDCKRRTPAMSASSVDLPTPSGPTKAVALPKGMDSEISATAVRGTVAVRDVPHLDRNRLARFFGHFLLGEIGQTRRQGLRPDRIGETGT